VEWLILVIVVPLVLVPLVLVFGFAGCGLDVVGTLVPTPTATNLTAKVVFVGNANKIILTWIGHPDAAKYELWRGVKGQSLAPLPPDHTLTMFTDTPPEEGTSYVYKVRAGTFGGTFGSFSNEAIATTLPAAPELADSIPLTTSHIRLNWTRKSAKGSLFRIERREPPAGFKYRNETTLLEFDDGVDAGGTYEYRVFDIVKDGFDESIPKAQVLSPPSKVVPGKPLAFAAKFVVAVPQPNLNNYCLIQRIRVTGTGSKIRLTIAGSGSGLTLDGIYISHVAPAGNPWDAAAQPTLIALGAGLAPGELVRSFPWVDFVISATPLDLLVAFDINSGAGLGNVRYVDIPGAGVEHYYLNYAQNPGVPVQAGVQDRVPTFLTGVDRHYLVEKLEVL
jgi:hypothetical protein